MSSTSENAEESEDMITDSDIDIAMNTNESMKQKFDNEFKYEVLSIEQIVKQIQECIEEIRAVIDLPSATIRTLLKHFKWDTQKLLEKLFDTNQEQLFADIGIVINRDVDSNGSQSKRRRLQKKRIVCLICYTKDVKTEDMFGLDCGHIYCKKCWNQYLTTKVMSEGVVNTITCAQTDCNVIADDDQILELLSDPIVKSKYKWLTTISYVESNDRLRWCPRPDCMHAFSVRSGDSEAHPVTCVCGTQICFGCGECNHQPIGCHLLRQWNKKSAGHNSEKIDGKTANWIITNTKECPKCRTSIEKNGGCNHMLVFFTFFRQTLLLSCVITLLCVVFQDLS